MLMTSRKVRRMSETMAASPGTQQAPPQLNIRQTPLRRNLQFQTIWIGQTAASLGISVANVAYPLAILAITGSPARAGLFGSVQAAGTLLAGLPAGSLADRYDPRTIVIAAEVCRVAVTAAVITSIVLGFVTLPLLLAAAALLGMGSTVSGSARLVLVRTVVPPSQLTQALTQDEVRQNGAALAGPAIAGALYAVRALAHAVPFLFTAGSLVLSLLTAVLAKFMKGTAADRDAASGDGAASGEAQGGANGAVQDGDAKDSDAQDDAGGMLVGLRTIWSQPALRAAMLLIMLVNTVGVGLDLAVIVILRQQTVPSAQIGLVLALGAVGGLAGAPLVKPLHRLPPGVLLLAACLLDVPLMALMAVPFGPWWVGALLFLSMLWVPAIRVGIDVLVIRPAPAAVRGRVVAALIMLIGVGMPVGMAGSGLLLQFLPAQAAMLVLAAILAAAVGYAAIRPELRKACWPQ
jgi:predicted MFS family arabinose efflux permease